MVAMSTGLSGYVIAELVARPRRPWQRVPERGARMARTFRFGIRRAQATRRMILTAAAPLASAADAQVGGRGRRGLRGLGDRHRLAPDRDHAVALRLSRVGCHRETDTTVAGAARATGDRDPAHAAGGRPRAARVRRH